jgi:predicted RNase H-like nuclease (RuvC/YqgF family)
VAEREKLRQQFEQVREQEERLLLKEREMASLNEKDLEYQKKIKDLETELEEEWKRREESEKELEGREVVVIGNGRPPSSISIQGV